VDEADLIKVLLETGIRDKEAAHMEWDDFSNGFLNLRDKPKYGWRLKDKETRSVPISPKLARRLKARKARQEERAKAEGNDAPTLVFPNSLNRPDLALDARIQRVQRKAVNGEWTNKDRRGKYEWDPKSEVTMHKFRKNYATFMHRHGCDTTTVAELLGHSDIETTKLYIAIDTQKAVDVSKIAFEAFGD
jgi:integrase